MTKSVVFEKGVTLNPASSPYGLEIRIPAIVKSGNTLVAFAEGRNTGVVSDFGDIDLICRRSTDGGATWGSVIYVDDNSTLTARNPAPVVNSVGDIICVFIRQSSTGPGTQNVIWYKKSTDAGATWGSAVNIDSVNIWGGDWVATGPSHGIRLRRGAHAGRLLVPIASNAGSNSRAGVIYSDDDGTSWSLGGLTTSSSSPPILQESSITETADGTVVLMNRNNNTSSGAAKTIAYSEDGGATFGSFSSSTVTSHTGVQGSVCQHHGSHLKPLLYSTPQQGSGFTRHSGAVVRSFDEGATWGGDVLITEPGQTNERYAYSDLVETGQDTYGLLYETGTDTAGEAYKYITYRELRVSPIAQRGSATTDNADNADKTSLVLTKPTGTVSGDVLVAFFTANSVAVTPPSGFTEVFSQIGSTSTLTSHMYVKVAGGSEPSTYTFTCSSGPVLCTLTAWSGVDNSNPVGTNFASSGGAGASEPQTTPTTNNDAVQGRVFYFRSAQLSGTDVTFTGPGGSVTELFDHLTVTSSNNRRMHALYTESTDFTGGGATKVGAAITASAAESNNTYATFVLRAAKTADAPSPAGVATANNATVQVKPNAGQVSAAATVYAPASRPIAGTVSAAATVNAPTIVIGRQASAGAVAASVTVSPPSMLSVAVSSVSVSVSTGNATVPIVYPPNIPVTATANTPSSARIGAVAGGIG